MYMIALVGIGLVLHGFLMLSWSAFKARPAWGFAVMLIPFAQVFFPIYHWERARRPFMVFTSGLALWLGTAIVFGQGPLDKFWLDQVSLVQSAEDFKAYISRRPLSLEERVQQNKETHPVVTNSAVVDGKIGERITRISAESSARFIGHNVRILLGNGKVRNGKITSVQQDRLSMHYTIGNKTIGSMSYELSYKDIKSIEIIS